MNDTASAPLPTYSECASGSGCQPGTNYDEGPCVPAAAPQSPRAGDVVTCAFCGEEIRRDADGDWIHPDTHTTCNSGRGRATPILPVATALAAIEAVQASLSAALADAHRALYAQMPPTTFHYKPIPEPSHNSPCGNPKLTRCYRAATDGSLSPDWCGAHNRSVWACVAVTE